MIPGDHDRSIIKEVVLDRGTGRGFRAGVTGLLSDPEAHVSRTDFAVEDPADAGRRIFAEPRPGTDCRIVMTGRDTGKAMSLAVLVPGISLPVVAHDYVAASETQQIDDTLIAMTANQDRMLSDARLQVPADSEKIRAETRFVPLDRTMPDDPAMRELIKRAEEAAGRVKRGGTPQLQKRASELDPDMESVSTVLFSLFHGTPRHEQWVVSCLEGAWPGLLGQNLAGVSRPRALEKSRLVVEVTDPEWAEALDGLKDEILMKLRAATGGEVQSVVFSRRGAAAPRDAE